MKLEVDSPCAGNTTSATTTSTAPTASDLKLNKISPADGFMAYRVVPIQSPKFGHPSTSQSSPNLLGDRPVTVTSFPSFPIVSKDSANNLGYFLSMSPRGVEAQRDWADLPKRVVYFLYRYTLHSGVSNISSVCLNWARFIETVSSMRCFFSLRMGVEVASIYKFFVSQKVSVANVRMMPMDYVIPSDLPKREEITNSSEISLTGEKVSFKAMIKKKIILPKNEKKEKELFNKMQVQFIYPHGLNKIKYTFFIHGVACNCGVIYTAIIRDEVLNKKPTMFLEPITCNSILLLQYLYDEYISNARI